MANDLVVKGACKQVQNQRSSHKKQCGCCGTSELWYLSMIQCSVCQQWFHEGCVKNLSKPLLLGDAFYIFACSSCNFGVEYVGRLQVTWLELVHLVLFHLMIKYRTNFCDLDAELLPWVKDHWDALQTGGMDSVSDEELRNKFLDALKSNPNRFKCGDETRQRVSFWTLRVCCPAEAPKYQLHTSDTVFTHSAINQILSTEPRFFDRKNESLQPVKKFFSNYPHKDEYYEKWTRARSERKRRRRKKTEVVSLPKRKAALESREKCQKMLTRQRVREMLSVDTGCIPTVESCISKRKVKRTSSRGRAPQVGKDCRSPGRRSPQTLESNVDGIPSGSELLRKKTSSQVWRVSWKKNKRGSKKTVINNEAVVKKRRRRTPRLCGTAETILWTNQLMAGVRDTAAVEPHGRNCTQREFTMLMTRRIPFYSTSVDDVSEYFNNTGHLAAREGCRFMGKRVSPEGLVEYLVVRSEPVHSLL